MKNRMANDVRRFIRFLGNFNEYKIIDTQAETRFTLGFYDRGEANQFLSAFMVLYEKVKNGTANENLFGTNTADKLCLEFIQRIYLGVVDENHPYLAQRTLGSDTIPPMTWISFWPQEQLTLAAKAFLELWLDYYTPSFERDYEGETHE